MADEEKGGNAKFGLTGQHLKEGMTVGHLQKGLTGAHLQQGLNGGAPAPAQGAQQQGGTQPTAPATTPQSQPKE